MVEIYNNAGTVSFGCFDHFKSARGMLDHLLETGQLDKKCPSVMVSSFRGDVLQRVDRATYRGKWRLITLWKHPKANAGKMASVKDKPRKGTCQRTDYGIDDVFCFAQDLASSGAQSFGAFSRQF